MPYKVLQQALRFFLFYLVAEAFLIAVSIIVDISDDLIPLWVFIDIMYSGNAGVVRPCSSLDILERS